MLRGMETINGCTVIRSSEATELVRFGPAETSGSYVVEVGSFPSGVPGRLFTFTRTPTRRSTSPTDKRRSSSATVSSSRRRQPRLRSAGTAHTVWNSGDGPVRGLILISPGDAEHEFVPVNAH